MPGVVAEAVVGGELQVRVVEEPYLRRVHGRAYDDYVGRASLLLPLIGRAGGA